MITEMWRDWWLRWLDWWAGRSIASRRLEALRREQAALRRRRLDDNRGHRWSTEVTMLEHPDLA
ncbi:hypothetical protein [Micromonospora sp. NBC_01813]|uniref:hypothetical protein n=1 Tax=Micromonospora sp. NBC_01813 TaxID=2975988 RepID=UPI002DD9BEEA|nr:hypothetical protein [Micromonospora sp. NBC_01813]WSA08431.1 hypothetical protein OG958_30310 [Micromonospora sp. NBC_01813]